MKAQPIKQSNMAIMIRSQQSRILQLLYFLLLSSSCLIVIPSADGNPVNDDACFATELLLDTTLDFFLEEATAELGEPNPGFGSEPIDPQNKGCNSNDGWCDFGAPLEDTTTATVWYTIVGPPSACLDITTNFDTFEIGEGYKGGDSQLAIYLARNNDCTDFDGFQEIAANDDKGTCLYYQGLEGCAAELTNIPVAPGVTYYVQVNSPSYFENIPEKGNITATACNRSPNYRFCGNSLRPDFLQCCTSDTSDVKSVGPACCGPNAYLPGVNKCCPNDEVLFFDNAPCPPTAMPTQAPTASPTKSPTASPTKMPTASPTKSPTASPTTSPTKAPTSSPTPNPTPQPTQEQTCCQCFFNICSSFCC